MNGGFMKLKQEKMLPESPKTIDITGFFKKFCIATRTIKSKHYRCTWEKPRCIKCFSGFWKPKFIFPAIDAIFQLLGTVGD